VSLSLCLCVCVYVCMHCYRTQDFMLARQRFYHWARTHAPSLEPSDECSPRGHLCATSRDAFSLRKNHLTKPLLNSWSTETVW
jgi:hypothetical protein